MKIRFLKDYKYAFKGYDVHSYRKGQEIDTDSEDLINNAIKAGFAEDATPSPTKQNINTDGVDVTVKADVKKPKKSRKTATKC